jgi:hypothetical protein
MIKDLSVSFVVGYAGHNFALFLEKAVTDPEWHNTQGRVWLV